MTYEIEILRERLLDLEQSRQRERTLRKQSEALLAGLLPLGEAKDATQIFSALADVLHELISFDQAYLLVQQQGGQLRAVAATSDDLTGTIWNAGALFLRVLSGEPSSVFDIRLVPEWQAQPAAMTQKTSSALLVPLASVDPPALLVCTHTERGAFGQNDLLLARRVGALAAQALRNIEQQRLAIAQAAREHEQQTRFRLLLDHSPDTIWISHNGRINYANRALLALLGYREPVLQDFPVPDLLHPDDRASFQRDYASLQQMGQSNPPQELRLRCADGTSVFVELVGLCLQIDGERALICLGRDVSNRKKLTARLMQIDRLSAAGTLAAGVGHEINNPLSFIVANVDFALQAIHELSDLVADDLPDLPPAKLQDATMLLKDLRDGLHSARHGGERITTIVSELRSFSKGPDEVDPLPVEVLPLINSARKMAWSQIQERARYVEDLTDLPRVLATRAHLAQVMLNLLINAAHSIPPGDPDGNEIRVTGSLQEQQVIIEVQDTGSGIRPEDQSRIFDPFFTTKSPDEGTGLGLSISQQTILSFGGRISFETELGRGTTFRVTLQIADEDLTTTEVNDFSDPSPQDRRPQLLVIDDEKEVGIMISRLLKLHADITPFTCAEDALELLDQGRKFDTILCDFIMPQMSGVEFYRRLQQDHPDLTERVVFITGGITLEETRQFIDEVNCPYIYKPFQRNTLLNALFKKREESPQLSE